LKEAPAQTVNKSVLVPHHCISPHYISVTVLSRGVNEKATLVLLMQILMPIFTYVLFLDKSAL
jgi:hypothetical protein